MAVIRGTNGPDNLVALADGDILIGLAGDDNLSSTKNFTQLFGNADNDTLIVVAQDALPGEFSDAVVFSLLDGGSGDDALEAEATASSDVTATATNILTGGDGRDDLDAMATANGGRGIATASNTLYGGDGNDNINAQATTNFGDSPTARLDSGSRVISSLFAVARPISSKASSGSLGRSRRRRRPDGDLGSALAEFF